VQDSSPRIVVIDAGVFVKLFLEEADSDIAVEFFDFARLNNLKLIAPSLFLYEVLAVAGPSVIGSTLAYDMIIAFTKAGFTMVDLDEVAIQQALVIANSGHPKSGFPTFYDAAYHALAMTCGGVFLTADKMHLAKTKAFGSAVLLDNWRPQFQKTHSS
jgi:predicted nucleic acid-binding protein